MAGAAGHVAKPERARRPLSDAPAASILPIMVIAGAHRNLHRAAIDIAEPVSLLEIDRDRAVAGRCAGAGQRAAGIGEDIADHDRSRSRRRRTPAPPPR